MYIIRCYNCGTEFDAEEAPLCAHSTPTKICPFCCRCFCNASEEFISEFRKNSTTKIKLELSNASKAEDLKLGEILINANYITRKDLDFALEKQKILKKKIGEILVMMDLISPEELRLFLMSQKSIDYIRADEIKVNYKLIFLIGRDFCLNNKLIPTENFSINRQNILKIILSDRQDFIKIKDCQELSEYSLIPFITDKNELKKILAEISDFTDPENMILLSPDQP